MTNSTEKHHKSCACVQCEAYREGAAAGAALGKRVAKVLARHLAPSKSKKQGPKCLRCGAGSEWIEYR